MPQQIELRNIALQAAQPLVHGVSLTLQRGRVLALVGAEWAHPYSREVAVFPAGVADKYWPTVKRLDDVYGDRNLFCSCVPISEYQ